MTVEEAWEVKAGDKVLILDGSKKGQIGYVPWVDRISDKEPHAVVLPDTFPGGYHLFKIERIDLLK